MCKSWQIGDSICKSQNLKVSNSRCMESLCPRIMSVYLQIPSIFWINERVAKRTFIYNVWIKYIINTFIIFPHIVLTTFLWVRNLLYMLLKWENRSPSKLRNFLKITQLQGIRNWFELVIQSLKGQFSSISLKFSSRQK